MDDDSRTDDVSQRGGELFTAEMPFTWINPNPIDAGEMLLPVQITSEQGEEFAALHLVARDLAFAAKCLREAFEHGLPDNQNVVSKALIFSGVVAYARSFKSGVRPRLRLGADHPQGYQAEIHDYLIALRDKHIAHSVNDFEDGGAIAILIGKPGQPWRDGGAVGAVIKQSVGISSAQLLNSVSHIEALASYVGQEIERIRPAIYSEFQKAFAKGERFAPAPLVTFSDKSKVADRRQ